MSDEYVDILDVHGNLTGSKLSRADAHKQEAWHGVTHVWIYNKNNQILLQRRHPDLEWAGDKWDLPAGGHVLSGETPTQAVLREAKEEISLDLDESKLELVDTHSSVSPAYGSDLEHKTFQWNFIYEMDLDPKTLKLQADETIDLKWFDLNEFESDINSAEQLKRYAPRQPELYLLIVDNIRSRIRSKNG